MHVLKANYARYGCHSYNPHISQRSNTMCNYVSIIILLIFAINIVDTWPHLLKLFEM